VKTVFFPFPHIESTHTARQRPPFPLACSHWLPCSFASACFFVCLTPRTFLFQVLFQFGFFVKCLLRATTCCPLSPCPPDKSASPPTPIPGLFLLILPHFPLPFPYVSVVLQTLFFKPHAASKFRRSMNFSLQVENYDDSRNDKFCPFFLALFFRTTGSIFFPFLFLRSFLPDFGPLHVNSRSCEPVVFSFRRTLPPSNDPSSTPMLVPCSTPSWFSKQTWFL